MPVSILSARSLYAVHASAPSRAGDENAVTAFLHGVLADNLDRGVQFVFDSVGGSLIIVVSFSTG